MHHCARATTAEED